MKQGGSEMVDSLDRTILQSLITSSRTPLTTIAKRIRRSKSTTHYRIGQLEKKKIILQYIAYYDLISLGYPMYILLVETDTKHQDTIVQTVSGNHFVHSVLGLASPTNLLIATYAKNRQHIDELLGEWSALDGVGSISLFPVKTMKFIPYVLFSKDKKNIGTTKTLQQLDRKDVLFLKALEYNSRLPLTELAPRINISAEALATRLKRLIRGGCILSLFTNVNIYSLGFQPYFMLIKLFRREVVQKVFSFVSTHPYTNGQYRLDHDYTIAVLLVVPDIMSFRTFMDGVRSIDSLATIQSFLVTDQYASIALPEGIYRDLLHNV